ncbi:hypothetical protein ACQJBY_013503 [Aegilops geniculata]
MGSPTASASSSAALTTLSLPAAFNGPPASTVPSPSASLITAKLTTSNFLLWKAQVLPPLRIAGATGYVDGTLPAPSKLLDPDDKGVRAPNPEYATWFRQDQIVLSYLLASMSDEVLQQVHQLETSRAIWSHVEEMYTIHCRASIVQIKMDMAVFRKGTLSMADYFAKIRANADQLTAVGRPMRDEDIITAIITGLDSDYEPLITAYTTRPEGMTLGEFYSHAISFDRRREYNAARLHLQHGGSSVNYVARDSTGNTNNSNRGKGNYRGKGRGNSGDRGGYNNNSRGGDRGNRGGGGSRQQGDFGGNRCGDRADYGDRGDNRVQCQLCRGPGHYAWECGQRYNHAFQLQQSKMAGLAAASPPSILGDRAWFTDTGATDHITGDLDRLTIREKYPGRDRIHTADGSGLHIAHRGHAILPTPSANLQLRNILHVPNTDKNLLSVNRLAVDNHAYLKYYPTHFLMKDLITKRVLLQGKCENGLYPIRPSSHHALSSVRLSAED